MHKYRVVCCETSSWSEALRVAREELGLIGRCGIIEEIESGRTVWPPDLKEAESDE